LLSVRQISKRLDGFALEDVSFEVQRGQYFVLLGPSGVGKSVLLEIIAGLTEPDAGRILLDGKDITDTKIQHRRVGLVFQNSTLFPHLNVYENIAYPLRAGKLGGREIHQRVTTLAEDFSVASLLKRRPQTLSGGETQRVSLARAVAAEPRCLLLDEPISSLDARSRPEVRALLRRLNTAGQTIVHVTHDYTEAVSLGENIAVMENGRIAQTGGIDQVFRHPKSEFVARFVGIRNFFKGHLDEQKSNHSHARVFRTGQLEFAVLSDKPAGAGYIMIRSNDVVIGTTPGTTSARNNFQGTIVEITRNGSGIEVVVDIGVEVASLVTAESVEKLSLKCGKKVWASFKAAAVEYVEQ